MTAAAIPRPTVAPFGIVVRQVATPLLVLRVRWIGPTPGAVRVKVTVAPSSGLPFGSVTVTVRVMFRGRLFRLNR